MGETVTKNYETVIKNRKVLTLNGVINVLSFGEDYLSLATDLGEVIVEGRELKIESLTKENGEILIKGIIDGVFYREQKNDKGFFKKIFK